MEKYLPYCVADDRFYDDPAAAGVERLGAPLVADPDPVSGYASGDSGPWRIHRAPGHLPAAGWKVHVSARPERAAHIVATALDACAELAVTAKHLRTRRLVELSQSKYADNRASGKVLVAYPADDATLTRLVRELAARLSGEPGARIPGDVLAVGSPIGLRHGAFVEAWVLDATGTVQPARMSADGLVVDTRGAGAGAQPPTEPPIVAELRRVRAQYDDAQRLDVTEVSVLHRSNAGGVYAARWPDGRRVVLKEARHHTGFDAAGVDAATRLRHEAAALRRLSGSGLAPEPVELLTRGDSDFLVMEHVDGPSLTKLSSVRNPAVVPSAPRAEYDAWVESCVDRLTTMVGRMHSLGVVHRDIHPGNVIDTDDRLVLVDFESSAVDGVSVGRGIQNPLVPDPDDLGPSADVSALERLAGLLVSPHFLLSVRRPELADELVDDARNPARGGPVDRRAADRLVAGIARHATPGRRDRLFPGDIAQFAGPTAGIGLLHGAAGVCAALGAMGRPVDPTWLDWLVDRALDRLAHPLPGLADGLHGVAVVLAGLGREEVAVRVARRLLDAPPLLAATWAGGTSGALVGQADVAVRTGDPLLLEHALELAEHVLDQVDAGSGAGQRPGLLDGWSGVALGLVRAADLLVGTGPDPDRLLAAAHRALDRERVDLVRVDGGLWARDRGRLMPYLGVGSAAFGLAAQALARRGRPVDGGDRDVAEVVETLAGPTCAQAGLLHGRAGQCLVLEALAPGHEAAAAHRRRLSWYEVPEGPHASLLLGDQLLRCSADLATGSAGAALAHSTNADALTRVLGLPALAEPKVVSRG